MIKNEITFSFNKKYYKTKKGYNGSRALNKYEKLEDIKLLDNEQIKETKYKGYFVTNKGRVIGSRGMYYTILKPSIANGYLHIIISINNSRKSISVHRLVAETFLPNINKELQVNHKDENPLNNCVENLEWCSPKYNTEYSQAKAIKCFKYFSKEFVGEFISIRDAARKLNLLQGEISNVLKGRRNQKHTKGYCFQYV